MARDVEPWGTVSTNCRTARDSDYCSAPQRPSKESAGPVGGALAVLPLAVGGTALASCCGAGFGCTTAACGSLVGASWLAASFLRGSLDFGFAAATASICGAGFVVGVAVDPVVAESAPRSCVAEPVEATCVCGAGFDSYRAPNNLLASEPSLSAQGMGGSCGN